MSSQDAYANAVGGVGSMNRRLTLELSWPWLQLPWCSRPEATIILGEVGLAGSEAETVWSSG